jgi:hypothetical protein
VQAPLILVGHLRVLAEHDVSYLIVGGVGGRLQGTPVTTGDLDIVPDPDPDNLGRLAKALSTPTTRKKSADSRVFLPHPVVHPSEFWSEGMTQYETANGGLDVLIELPGVGAYGLLTRRARRYDLRAYGISVRVASLDDIIASKEFADRSKDWRALDSYYEARARLTEYGDDYELDPEALDVTHPPPGGTDELDEH